MPTFVRSPETRAKLSEVLRIRRLKTAAKPERIVMEPTGHVHRWQVEPPSGPTSKGECLCGEVREFENVIEGVFNNTEDL